MVNWSKRACLYVLMCAACPFVWTQEQICIQLCLRLCLWLCLWLRRGGPLRMHHPSHSHKTPHSWHFSHHWFYTVASLIGYHCIRCSQSTAVQSCAGLLIGANVTIRFVLYLHSASFLQITLLLVTPQRCCSSLWFVHFSATCIPWQWRGSSSVHPAQHWYLYSATMARILLCFVHIYVVLVHNENFFRHC